MNSAERTPLLTQLLHHSRKQPLQFHIPGHKCGKGMDAEFRAIMGDAALSLDLINIMPLDDLHSPHGVIKEAEHLAAQAFGADHTFFSVNGTSGAIMAMIMAVCQPGDTLIVPRNAHKSIMSALILGGLVPRFVPPEIDADYGVAHGITLAAVESALQSTPKARALLAVCPTYFGACADIAGMAALAHRHGIPLLVDEAHGAHLYFNRHLPIPAMNAGADAAATSMHKLGGSLTQSSLLNLQGALVAPQRVRTLLSLLTSTSTSYLLLASLDAARRYMALHGAALLDQALALAHWARGEINRIPGLSCWGGEIVDKHASLTGWDPTKLCINVQRLGISGLAVEKLLRTDYGIEVELSDPGNLLCLITIGDTRDTVEQLVRALRSIAARYPAGQSAIAPVPDIDGHCLALAPRDAFFARSTSVPIDQAAGLVAAEFVHVYPPGIPLLVPGEIITANDIAYIRRHQSLGFLVQGPEDPAVECLKVVADS